MKATIDKLDYDLNDSGQTLQFLVLLFSRKSEAVALALAAITSSYNTTVTELEAATEAHALAQTCLSQAISYAMVPSLKTNDALLEQMAENYNRYTGDLYPLTEAEEKYKKALKKR